MAKDPALLFYTSDFLSTTQGLSLEEIGMLIKLLCIQHQNGHLSKKAVKLAVGEATEDVLSFFKLDENGLYYNERLDNEKKRRADYSESRRKNRLNKVNKTEWQRAFSKSSLSNLTAKLVDTVDGDEKTGVKIVLKALEEPVRQIAKNAGFDGGVVVNEIMNSGKVGYGFDAYNEVFCDMMSAGIVDPTKVTRSALQNAASIASVILTTESVVADIKEAEPAAPAAGAGMGGMY